MYRREFYKHSQQNKFILNSSFQQKLSKVVYTVFFQKKVIIKMKACSLTLFKKTIQGIN